MTRHARHYLSGLLGTPRRNNMERIQSDVVKSDYEGIQQFVSDSPWDHTAVMRQVAAEAAVMLGGSPETALYLDESSVVKKGNASVGVQRQYCGRLGKVENCQVGVFASLGCGTRATLVDFRLFLPAAWARNSKRCAKAQHQVRGWPAWHHHMALVCLALLFMLKERGRAKEQTPLLSARDIVERLAIYLPRRPRNEAEVRRQMHRRHEARQRDLANRRRRLPRARKAPAKKLPKIELRE